MWVDDFLRDRLEQPSEESSFAWWANHQELELLRVGREQLRPSSRRSSFGEVAERTAYRSEEFAAHEQREYRGVDQRLDNRLAAARELVHSVSCLQLLEDQFDLPACAVGVADLLGCEHVDRDVRHVAMVLVRVLVENSDKSEAA